MNFIAATFLSLLAAATAQTDTAFTVTPGTRLNVFNFGGRVEVSAWPQNRVRIRATHMPITTVEIQRKGPALLVSSRSQRAPARSVDYDIHVPAWIQLNVSGINNDVSVTGVDGDVVVETVRGDVRVKGGKGLVSLRSLEGSVRTEGARGRVQVSSVNDRVSVFDAVGDVVVSTVNGNILLDRVVSDLVEASSANGDLVWDGEFKKSGRYQFGTHNGDIVVVTRERPNATVSVETFSGDFESSFPVELRGTQAGQNLRFTFGDGGALVGFESFQGAIRWLKAGSDEAKRLLERRARTVEELNLRLERNNRRIERLLERRREGGGDEDE